jgi:phosphohistidine phosphatase
MWVYLMRHGIAIPGDHPKAPKTDGDRWLTPEGRARTQEAARGLLALQVSPSRVLASPLLRARETASLVAAELRFPKDRIEIAHSLAPDAPPEAIWRDIDAVADAASVVAVGHAPHLDLALAVGLGVSEAISRLKKASVACLDRPTPGHSGRLSWLLEPGQLRRLGG